MKFIALFLVVYANTAIAWEDEEYRSIFNKCGDGTQIELNICFSDQFSIIDKQLNATYKELTSTLENPSLIKKSQLNWIEFRDAECKFRTSGLYKGGSMYSMSLSICRIELSLKRVRELEAYTGSDYDCNGCPPRKGNL